MSLDLLILNPPSDEFYYIPVGTFALCHWLNSKGYSARIANLSQAPRDDALAHAARLVEVHNPKNLGLILHWKETLNAFLAVGDHLRKARPRLPIWAGGITAGYYAEELLARAGFLSGVVRGDSERPMEAICGGASRAGTPNLYWRSSNGVESPTDTWWADEAFLDQLRYGDLSVLDDWGGYLALVDSRLGIPLAPGRGCALDCGYCGGSSSAFQLHSGRPRLALRSPGKVVDDLEEAFGLGARNFLLSHTPSVCEEIVREVAARFPSPLPFTLHLESWSAPPASLLERYAGLGAAEGLRPRFVLLSLRQHGAPGGSDGELGALVEASERLHALDPSIEVTIFYGFYTPWQGSRESLDTALRSSVETRTRVAGKKTEVAMMALSTDPASRWSLDEEAMQCDLSLSRIATGCMAEAAVLNNLLLHRPRGLSDAQSAAFQKAWHLDSVLFREAHPLWSALTGCLPFDKYRRLLDQAGKGCYCVLNGRVFPAAENPLPAALAALVGILEEASEDDSRMAVLKELAEVRLAAIVARSNQRRHTLRQASGDLPGFLALNPLATYRSRFDFGGLWQQDAAEGRVSPRDVEACLATEGAFGYLLLPAVSPPQSPAEMDMLRAFDGVARTEALIEQLCGELRAPDLMVRNRVKELWADGVLVSE